tara:strand:+ start:1079 stop:1450 length:372 start_codon:yes stop_codon:yes gene_type:complete
MSLNWNAQDVHDFEVLHDDEAQWAITKAIVFRTMLTNMGKITEKNCEEFYTRIALCDECLGPTLVLEAEDGEMKHYFITLADVKRRIGLETNVSEHSKAKFNGWLVRTLRRDVERSIREQKEE